MKPGKAASQAGHAFLDSFLKAKKCSKDAYLAQEGGTKVVLGVDSEERLIEIYNNAVELGLPASLVVDDGITTAAGIGPAQKNMIRKITKRLKLL